MNITYDIKIFKSHTHQYISLLQTKTIYPYSLNEPTMDTKKIQYYVKHLFLINTFRVLLLTLLSIHF